MSQPRDIHDAPGPLPGEGGIVPPKGRVECPNDTCAEECPTCGGRGHVEPLIARAYAALPRARLCDAATRTWGVGPVVVVEAKELMERSDEAGHWAVAHSEEWRSLVLLLILPGVTLAAAFPISDTLHFHDALVRVPS